MEALLGFGLSLPAGVTNFEWDWAYVWKALPSLLKMIPITLELAVGGIFFGTLIGLLIALMKISPYSVLNYLGSVYTWIFRGIPLLVQLFIIFFGVSLAFKIFLPPKLAAVIGISLCGGAYIAEIIPVSYTHLQIRLCDQLRSRSLSKVKHRPVERFGRLFCVRQAGIEYFAASYLE